MRTVCLHTKEKIEAFLRRNTFLNLYALGDLDDLFWPSTIWYALENEHTQELVQVALLYIDNTLPVLLGTTDDLPKMRELLLSIMHLLPKKFYAHLECGLSSVFADDYRVLFSGQCYKMALRRDSYQAVDTSEVIQLTMADVDELEALYRVSYPENQFNPHLLETGYYYGMRRQGKLVSVGGVHVYSKQYSIAAIGNVTTHPSFRGQRLAETVCGKLCQMLKASVEDVGLHVRSDNASAIACYERLGFEVVTLYEEYTFERL